MIAQRLKVAVLIGASLLSCTLVSAQEAPEHVEPDRPDVTNGTRIVQPGIWQIEFGGIYTRATRDSTESSSPITLRVGLTDWIEVRVGADGVTTENSAGSRATGFGNVQLGAKLRLWSEPGGVPVLSVLPGVNVPTADSSRGLGSGDTDYTLAFLTGTDFLGRGHIDVNYGIGAIGAGAGQPHFTQHLVSASLSAALTDRWNPYVEIFRYSRTTPDGSGETTVDTGVIYELGSHFALDGGVEFGIGGTAAEFGAFGGLSVAVGAERAVNGRHKVPTPKTRRH